MLNAGAVDQFLCMRMLSFAGWLTCSLFSSIFICFSSSKYLLGSWLAHCMGNFAMWRCDLFKQRRSFSFSYIPSTEMCFSLLSWDFFLVGMMISRTGWTSVGAFCGCIFPAGRKRFLSFFLSFSSSSSSFSSSFLRENRSCNDVCLAMSWDLWEKWLLKVPFCDGALLKSYKHWKR